MQGALVILGVLIAVGLLLFYADRRKPHGHHLPSSGEGAGRGEPKESGEATEGEQVCCGLHAVCEKKYSMPPDSEPLYYDDEELDVLSGRDPQTFTDEEIEMLRDVVLTLRPEDAWGWSRSLEQRHIQLPPEIRDELLLLLGQ